MIAKVIAGDRHSGRLTHTSANAYKGERRRMDGRMDSRIFHATSNTEATFMWETWKEAGARADRAALAARAKRAPKQTDKAEEQSMNTNTSPAGLYVLTVVGGAPLYVFDNEDKAFAVCDALTAAAKASGFAAKYDVSEVKKWAE